MNAENLKNWPLPNIITIRAPVGANKTTIWFFKLFGKLIISGNF